MYEGSTLGVGIRSVATVGKMPAVFEEYLVVRPLSAFVVAATAGLVIENRDPVCVPLTPGEQCFVGYMGLNIHRISSFRGFSLCC